MSAVWAIPPAHRLGRKLRQLQAQYERVVSDLPRGLPRALSVGRQWRRIYFPGVAASASATPTRMSLYLL